MEHISLHHVSAQKHHAAHDVPAAAKIKASLLNHSNTRLPSRKISVVFVMFYDGHATSLDAPVSWRDILLILVLRGFPCRKQAIH